MINNLYIDGVPIIRLGPIMCNIFKNKFHGITCNIKNNPQEAKEEIDKVWSENLSAEELKEVPHFYMPGGLNYEKIGFVDRTLMRIFSKMMERKKDKTASDEECAKAITASYDISSKDYIKPLVKYIKEGKLAQIKINFNKRIKSDIKKIARIIFDISYFLYNEYTFRSIVA